MSKKIRLIFYYLFKFSFYRVSLGGIGIGSKLLGIKLSGNKRIFIGKNVYIQKNTWLAAEPVTNKNNCSLIIGNDTYIGHNCHIYASEKIEIGNKVLFADKVYVSDNQHGYKNILLPIIDQPIEQLAHVFIKDGAWIGENACIIGASVGKNSVVGANAVVIKDVPDYCVAVGAPAKIIKRYNFELNIWSKTDEKGNFI
jgi:acetyltransferase-like isoleucine patch superfamily enzyme